MPRATALALVAAFAPAAVWAQGAPASAGAEGPAGTADRTLAGHVFTPTLLARSPFTLTTFQADLVYGSGSATAPAVDVGGVSLGGNKTYTFAAMGQTFAYDHKLGEHASIGGGIVAQLYSGLDGASAVVLGAEIQYGAFGRGTYARRYGPVQVGLTLDGGYTPRYAIQVLSAIQKALQEGGLDVGAAFDDSNVWAVRPGLAVAWAPLAALGLTASVNYQWMWVSRTDASSQDDSGATAALAADLDLGTFTSAPISLLLAYALHAPLDSAGVTRLRDFSVGVYYTGRPALVLGFEVGHRDLGIRQLEADAIVSQVRLQYVW